MLSFFHSSILTPVALTSLLYLTVLAFYRLFLHPLVRFPGPKLAAITRYYEAYYDVVQNGQYMFKIAELHKQYNILIEIFISFVGFSPLSEGPIVNQST